VLDEPEAALHRAAEANMADGLAQLAAHVQAQVVVATHSPELLDSRGGRRVLVRRKTADRRGGLVPFTGADHASMEALGLLPSDLLRRTRGFLLVEGEHDVQVLDGAFGSDLKTLGVDLLPLRGGARLKSALDSRFLFDYTEAVILPFLDDVDAALVTAAWDSAATAAKTLPRSEAIQQLNEDLGTWRGKGREYLEPFLARALQTGKESRVVPLGIQGPDVLDDLPVELFVPGARSWQELRAELSRDSGGRQVSETEFKAWLRGHHQADLTPEHVRTVAEASTPHPELVGLVEQVKTAVQSMG